MQDLALQFAFKVNRALAAGFNQRISLVLAAGAFKRNITAIAYRKRIDNEKSHRRYYFNDNSCCIFCNGEFTLAKRAH